MRSAPVRTVLLIAGMRGNACRETIARLLEAIAGVREVDVNLFRGQATVLHADSAPPGGLVNAIRTAGYSAAIVTTGAAPPAPLTPAFPARADRAAHPSRPELAP